jgi:hypothetical protein
LPAANAPATQILPQPGSPVQIDMCSFTYLPGDARLTAHVDIKNTGEKLVNDVLASVIPSATGTPSALLSNLWPPGDD